MQSVVGGVRFLFHFIFNLRFLFVFSLASSGKNDVSAWQWWELEILQSVLLESEVVQKKLNAAIGVVR